MTSRAPANIPNAIKATPSQSLVSRQRTRTRRRAGGDPLAACGPRGFGADRDGGWSTKVLVRMASLSVEAGRAGAGSSAASPGGRRSPNHFPQSIH
ncbi:MAG: hypothetical protein ACKOE2_09345, partial [Actinomycetales bacterium]